MTPEDQQLEAIRALPDGLTIIFILMILIISYIASLVEERRN
jgi:hypothetical protein